MYAKSFIARNIAGRLAGARTALRSPGERYTCHYCGSALVLHAESERPWFAHTDAAHAERGWQEYPYIPPDVDEVLLMRQLQRYIPNAMPVVSLCKHEYYADREAVCS